MSDPRFADSLRDPNARYCLWCGGEFAPKDLRIITRDMDPYAQSEDPDEQLNTCCEACWNDPEHSDYAEMFGPFRPTLEEDQQAGRCKWCGGRGCIHCPPSDEEVAR